MIANLTAILVVIIGVVGIGWIIWLLRHGDTDRHDEDRARVFFDEHGHWPDETLEEAEAERARLAAAAGGPMPTVTRAGSDGVV
jgi:hypothetical protein